MTYPQLFDKMDRPMAVCPRCAGLLLMIVETLDTYTTAILRCMNCGMRKYAAYEPDPMRPVVMERRGRPKGKEVGN